MKKITIVILVLLALKSNSQTLPLNTWENIPNGAYLKDLNDEYLPYVGTWKAVKDNKEYTFVFQVFYQHLKSFPNGTNYYEDELKGKYEVKDIPTGNILFTTMSAVNYDDFWISALSTPDSDGRLHFHFCDIEHCYNIMTFSLRRVPGSTTQLKYGLFNYQDWWNPQNCPAYPERTDVPVPIPKNAVTYTKQ